MRVLVAGATGVLGRATVPALLAAGHEVYGLARTPQALLTVDKMGAQAVRGDLLDAISLKATVDAARPEAIVNLATAIPRSLKIVPSEWEPNDRLRIEGSANLRQAAQNHALRLFVQESVGYICRSQGSAWITEESPLNDHPFLQATRTMEAESQRSSLPMTLLRFAALADAHAWHIEQSIAMLKRGLLPIIGTGDAYVSLIHAQDAAQAIACALAQPEQAAGQIFNVVDDVPAPMKEVWPFVARLLHAPAPKHVPPILAKMGVGALTLEILGASYRMSNTKIRQTLGFSPRFPSYREIWTQISNE